MDRRAGLSKVTPIVVQRVCEIPAESCKLPSGPHGVVLIEFAGTGERGRRGLNDLHDESTGVDGKNGIFGLLSCA